MPAVDPESALSRNVSDDNPWRQEVASRVRSYRRRNRGDDSSLRLDFEAASAIATTNAVAHALAEPDPEVSCDINYFRRTNAATAPVIDSPVDDPDFEDFVFGSDEETSAQDVLAEVETDVDFDFNAPQPPMAVEPQPDPPNLIVFPTQPTYQAPPAPMYELAEPVLEHPRILDVPEEAVLPTIEGPLFENLQIYAPDSTEEISPRPLELELPLQVAMVNQRLYAAVMDWLFVVCGFGIFAGIAWRMMGEVPHTKLMLMVAIAAPAIFWIAYQYMFITYSGETPGMQMAGLSLANFEGGWPNQRRRRTRALSMIVSLISCGIGFGWALLDPDSLCWHDSISRTYVTQQN